MEVGIDILGLLRVLCTPNCWIQDYELNLEHDKWLVKSLGTSHFEEGSTHTVMLNGNVLWVANHPYASFTNIGMRAKRITILRAMDKLNKDKLNWS